MNTRHTYCTHSEQIPIKPESDRLDDYLSSSTIVDWQTPAIVALAESIAGGATSDVDKSKRLYQWVRDTIPHSCDARHETVTCRASEVLELRTGLCFAKSHLLAAMLRAAGIPAGFCYQRLRLAPDSNRMILHGLNGICLKSIGQWIRVDPRGNKPGVDAEFRLDGQQLAFPANPALDEVLYPTIFAEPLPSIVECLTMSKSVSEALERLPDSIDAK